MNITQLKLETVTPMFLRGYDNSSLELRPPSFKALFRYWWRAAVMEMDIDNLRKREGCLFGNTKGRSPLSIRISGIASLQSDKYAPLPHKHGGFTNQAYSPNGNFNITLMAPELCEYEKIAELGVLLGGVGNRSRRGFGSIRYQNWSFQNVNELQQKVYQTLDEISPGQFQACNHKIQNSTVNLSDYPVIQAIYFGQNLSDNVDSLLRQIGQATHKYSDNALGSINPRMASPIHVRIQKVNGQFVPIATQLNSVFPNNAAPHNYEQIQQDFINAVITIGTHND